MTHRLTRRTARRQPQPGETLFEFYIEREIMRAGLQVRLRTNMLHKCTCLLAGMGVAVLLSQPSTAWAQGERDLTIALTHSGVFTVGQTAAYTIVVSNIGGSASSGSIQIVTDLPSATGTGLGWSCFQVFLSIHFPVRLHCVGGGFIAPGTSAPPITVPVSLSVSGTVTNSASVIGVVDSDPTNNTATDVTIVAAAVPTLPESAMIALSVLLALAGFAAMRRRNGGATCQPHL